MPPVKSLFDFSNKYFEYEVSIIISTSTILSHLQVSQSTYREHLSTNLSIAE